MIIGNSSGRVIEAKENYYNIEKDVLDRMKDMNDFSRSEIFGVRELALRRGEFDELNRPPPVFTGSFATMYSAVPYVNRTVGDIDLILPYDTEKYVEEYLRTKDIAYRRIGTQIHFIEPKNGIQVDLEFKEYFDRLPSEFSRFSNSWSPNDVSQNIKGVFSKILLSSMTAATDEKYCFSVSHGLRMRFEESDKNPREYSNRDMETIFKALFIEPMTKDSSDTNYRFAIPYMRSFTTTFAWIYDKFETDTYTKVLAKFTKKLDEISIPSEDIDPVLQYMKAINY
jgi:hypothetical protein